MLIKINDTVIEATEDNLFVMTFDNDLLDGIYLDMEEDYLYVSKHDEEPYMQMLEVARQVGSYIVTSECKTANQDELDEVPILWFVKSVGRTMVAELEDMLYGE